MNGYQLFETDEIGNLQQLVDEAMNAGMVPCGGVAAVVIQDYYDGKPSGVTTYYAQAMVKADALLPAMRRLQQLAGPEPVPVKVKRRKS